MGGEHVRMWKMDAGWNPLPHLETLVRKIPILKILSALRHMIRFQNPAVHQRMEQKSINIPVIDQNFQDLIKGGSLSF